MVRRAAVNEVVTSRKAPKPLGASVQAVRVTAPREALFVSGQLPIELPSGKPFTGDIKRQAELAIGHLRNIVTDAGFLLEEVVQCTLYLKAIKDFEAVNQVYQKFFITMNMPALSVLQVAGLPHDAGLQIDAVAMKKGAGEVDVLDVENHP